MLLVPSQWGRRKLASDSTAGDAPTMIDEAVVLVVGALTGGRGESDEAGGMVPRVIPVCGQTVGSGVSMSGPYTRPLLSPSDPGGGGGGTSLQAPGGLTCLALCQMQPAPTLCRGLLRGA